MSVHIKIWMGSASARITDMANAGKRGKTCRVLRVQGCMCDIEQYRAERDATVILLYRLAEICGSYATYGGAICEHNYDELREMVLSAVPENMRSDAIHIYDETCRGIDAPRATLTAGVTGVWSGCADEHGLHLRDLTDMHNEPTMITPHDQTKARAYDLARKVWPAVQAAKSMHEASTILEAAGCRLHYFCAVD